MPKITGFVTRQDAKKRIYWVSVTYAYPVHDLKNAYVTWSVARLDNSFVNKVYFEGWDQPMFVLGFPSTIVEQIEKNMDVESWNAHGTDLVRANPDAELMPLEENLFGYGII